MWFQNYCKFLSYTQQAFFCHRALVKDVIFHVTLGLLEAPHLISKMCRKCGWIIFDLFFHDFSMLIESVLRFTGYPYICLLISCSVYDPLLVASTRKEAFTFLSWCTITRRYVFLFPCCCRCFSGVYYYYVFWHWLSCFGDTSTPLLLLAC